MPNSSFNKKMLVSSSKETCLVSYLLRASPSQNTINVFTNYMKEQLDQMASDETKCLFNVFKSVLGEKTFYICWSGGKIKQNGDLELTIVGQAALEALALYPEGNNKQFAFIELKLGLLPLQDKITIIMNQLPHNTKICFWGDMATELEGKLFRAFNVFDFDGSSLALAEQRLEDLQKNSSFN